MRKYLAMMFVLMLAATIGLSACAKKEEPPPPPPPAPAAAPADNDGRRPRLQHLRHLRLRLKRPRSSFPGSTVPRKGAGVSPAPFSFRASRRPSRSP